MILSGITAIKINLNTVFSICLSFLVTIRVIQIIFKTSIT